VNDTVEVFIEIINDDSFVAFQFDLPLPDQFGYISNSTSLLGREVDHVIISSLIGDDTLRIISYSPSNIAFLGDSGMVASIGLISGQQTGSFQLEPQNAIISAANSNNILTDIVNGVIVIEPNTDVDNHPLQNNSKIDMIKFPNPFKKKLKLHCICKIAKEMIELK